MRRATFLRAAHCYLMDTSLPVSLNSPDGPLFAAHGHSGQHCPHSGTSALTRPILPY